MEERTIPITAVSTVFGAQARVIGGNAPLKRIDDLVHEGRDPAEIPQLAGSGSHDNIVETIRLIAEALLVAKYAIEFYEAARRAAKKPTLQEAEHAVRECCRAGWLMPDGSDWLRDINELDRERTAG